MIKEKNFRLAALTVIACFAAFTVASQTIQPTQNDLSKQLIGEWRNVYLKIIIHHPGKPVVTMEADSSNWEKRLGIKPIRTHFKEDGTYYSEYLNLKDSLVRRPAGQWHIKGDSLTMTQETPDKSAYTLKLKIDKNIGTFSGIIDFEGDGKADDEYFGMQKKVN